MIYNIKVKIENGKWINAKDYQIDAFIKFMDFEEYDTPYIYNNLLEKDARIYFMIKREVDHKIFITKENGDKLPIANWNNVKIFNKLSEWCKCRNYQTWAYFDFIYSDDNCRIYINKKNNNHNNSPDYIKLPFNNLPNNINFKIYRNDNGSISYQDNYIGNTRISDNTTIQNNYLNYFNRMNEII